MVVNMLSLINGGEYVEFGNSGHMVVLILHS